MEPLNQRWPASLLVSLAFDLSFFFCCWVSGFVDLLRDTSGPRGHFLSNVIPEYEYNIQGGFACFHQLFIVYPLHHPTVFTYHL